MTLSATCTSQYLPVGRRVVLGSGGSVTPGGRTIPSYLEVVPVGHGGIREELLFGGPFVTVMVPTVELAISEFDEATDVMTESEEGLFEVGEASRVELLLGGSFVTVVESEFELVTSPFDVAPDVIEVFNIDELLLIVIELFDLRLVVAKVVGSLLVSGVEVPGVELEFPSSSVAEALVCSVPIKAVDDEEFDNSKDPDPGDAMLLLFAEIGSAGEPVEDTF